jgi:hypothetical protein
VANRIADLIGRYEARIAGLNGVGVDGRPVDSLHDEMKLSMDEFVQFQNMQASAHAQGIITTEEAQTVYIALGGECFNPDWPEGTSLGTKTAITQLMLELIERRVKGRRGTVSRG